MNETNRLILNVFLVACFVVLFDLLFRYVTEDKLGVIRWKNNILQVQNREIILRRESVVIKYLFITLGLAIFVFPTHSRKKEKKEGYEEEEDENELKDALVISHGELFLRGFIWGLLTFGVLNFHNYSIFFNYSYEIALLDTFWGGILTGLSVLLTFLITTTIQ